MPNGIEKRLDQLEQRATPLRFEVVHQDEDPETFEARAAAAAERVGPNGLVIRVIRQSDPPEEEKRGLS